MASEEMLFKEFVYINPTVRLARDQHFPFIPMEDLTPGRRYVRASATRVAGGGAKFVHGDTLFARITPCLENGKIAQFQAVPEQAAFGSTEYWVFRARDGISDPAFVYYLASTDIIRMPAEKSMAGASGRQRADIAAISDLKIEVPNFPTQRRIASILSAYDDLIENNTRRIAILEEMARRIYDEWFFHFRFPGHAQVRMVESKWGLIPEGWRWGELRDIAYDVRDSVNPDATNPATPYVGLEHIPRRSLALAEWGSAADVQSAKLRFSSGDILFGKIRPYFHKVAIAPVAGVTSSDAIVIRAKSTDWFPMVLSTVSCDAFVAEATQSSNGAKMPRANWNVLLGYKIPLAEPKVREQFNDFVNGVAGSIKNMTLRSRNLRTTRDLLLPKLISGELDVSHLPEPEAMVA